MSEQLMVHGDSVEWTRAQPAGSFDVIATDVPYGVPMQHKGVTAWHLDDNLETSDTKAVVEASCHEWARVLGETGVVYAMCGDLIYAEMQGWMHDAGFKTRPWVWCKTNPRALIGPWRIGVELGLFGYRRLPPKAVEGAGINYHVGPTVGGGARVRHPETDDTHPTQKPVAMVEEWLRRTPGRVLDPFAGSGSMLEAARTLDLDAVGVERSREFFEIACHRLSQPVSPVAPEGGAPAPEAGPSERVAQRPGPVLARDRMAIARSVVGS